MKKDEYVSTIMATDLVTLCISDDLVTAEKLFIKNKIKHIPVVKEKEIIGMLSYTDMQRVCCSDVSQDKTSIDSFVYNTFTIEQVMAKNIIAVPPYTSIKDAAELLKRKEFHALPVIEDSELVGIVTTRDFVRYLAAEL
ncbi:CBS domain-containing protein [Polaribacter sp. SA4-12]|uniref:CBS domain-containing protein n=1 Tax=Polaribacter sp. SA4-12 TaxID=1312072 RepID=UPI000B3CE7FF|nr:CBS domain-containing protein [Polaribacter sp. SA4-12]ARV15301.1 CBS domain-containing protein [Polaribacter sp. SA4-12]